MFHKADGSMAVDELYDHLQEDHGDDLPVILGADVLKRIHVHHHAEGKSVTPPFHEHLTYDQALAKCNAVLANGGL